MTREPHFALSLFSQVPGTCSILIFADFICYYTRTQFPQFLKLGHQVQTAYEVLASDPFLMDDTIGNGIKAAD